MVLGIIEDFSTDVSLDTELTQLPENGIYLNSGVNPLITVNNLLSFLPFNDIVLNAWDYATIYNIYSKTRKKTDLVTYDGKFYQSIKGSNLNNVPDESNSEYWLETNFDSLKIKMFLQKVTDRVYRELNLSKRLIENQFIYEVGENEVMLPNNYSAWVFEPKGSDYVTITLNQISLQKQSTTPIDLYVVNQGILKDTLTITPSNGIVDFKDINYSFNGKGKWFFVIDSTEVLTNSGIISPLKYDGFVCYTATGIGSTPQNAKYSYGQSANGLGFNVSVSLNSQTYIDNNINSLANFVRATFELMALEMMFYNSETRSNRDSKNIQLNKQDIGFEIKSLEGNTVAKRFQQELSQAKKAISKSFDTQLFEDSLDLEIEIDSL